MDSPGGPRTVYLIRHGEKLGDPENEKDGGSHLSIRGSARAAALPSLFVPDSVKYGKAGTTLSCELNSSAPGFAGADFAGDYVAESLRSLGPTRFSTPDVIFATSHTKPTAISRRPYETVIPLACALKLSINASIPNGDEQELADELAGGQYAGKTVLIAWHHGALQTLARAIGGGKTNAPKWSARTFDALWEIAYSQNPRDVIRHTQALLYGDSPPATAVGDDRAADVLAAPSGGQ